MNEAQGDVEGSNEDPSRTLVLDGNAAAGLLQEVFSSEMTAAPTECAHCGYSGEVGTLMAYGMGPGVVLRCPSCEDVVLRVSVTPYATYVDARGAAYLRLNRSMSASREP
jgi:hypothetical protein